jgi:N-carbamoylputrescine amidase
VLVHRFDLDAVLALRSSWGLFRDRRIDLYRSITSLDGRP